MDRYIGIDAHSGSCTVAVMSASGKHIGEPRIVEMHAAALIDVLQGIPGHKHVCIEEGELAEWLVEALSPHVKTLVVVQPPEHHGNKSDASDAWGLAERIRVGAKGTYVFKPTTQFRALREAVRAYAVAVKEMTRAKNRFRALLRSRGVNEISYDPDLRAEMLNKLSPGYRKRAEWLGQLVDAAVAASEHVSVWVEQEGAKIPEVALIQTVPGIGPLRAAQIVATVVTPHRFRTRQQFFSYCGLAVVMRGSNQWSKTGNGWRPDPTKTRSRGLNTNFNRMMKAVFKGAAMRAISCEGRAREDFERLVKNHVPEHLARLTVARHIAATVLAIWKRKEVYDPAKHRIQHAA